MPPARIVTDRIPTDKMLSPATFWLLAAASSFVYAAGLLVPVMDIDAAQYAAISREMLESGRYLQVFNRGQDYLDKPPLLFWLSAASFKLLGISTVAYKLPSFLATLLGLYSTTKLAAFLYDRETARLATLILFTCQAFFLFNNDVRTDTLLTALVIFSSWQLIVFSEKRTFINCLLGFTGIALAMMAKGPIGAVVPASALATQFAIKGQWKKFIRWEWYAGLVWVFILLLPMLSGLYRQFGIEGPLFFFWTQSFGRITGESVWDNHAGYFYFAEAILWAFLPWSALLYFGFFERFRRLFRSGFKAQGELYTAGGFLLPAIALSFSHYKLPHYIFVVFPFASVITAVFLLRTATASIHWTKAVALIQWFVILASLLLIQVLLHSCFPIKSVWLWLLPVLAAILILGISFFYRKLFRTTVIASAATAILVNFIANTHLYPSLLRYQAGSELAIKSRETASTPAYFCNFSSYAFEFYRGETLTYIDTSDILALLGQHGSIMVVGRKDLYDYSLEHHLPVKRVTLSPDYPITRLTARFLIQKSREATLEKIYLIEFGFP